MCQVKSVGIPFLLANQNARTLGDSLLNQVNFLFYGQTKQNTEKFQFFFFFQLLTRVT